MANRVVLTIHDLRALSMRLRARVVHVSYLASFSKTHSRHFVFLKNSVLSAFLRTLGNGRLYREEAFSSRSLPLTPLDKAYLQVSC